MFRPIARVRIIKFFDSNKERDFDTPLYEGILSGFLKTIGLLWITAVVAKQIGHRVLRTVVSSIYRHPVKSGVDFEYQVLYVEKLRRPNHDIKDSILKGDPSAALDAVIKDKWKITTDFLLGSWWNPVLDFDSFFPTPTENRRRMPEASVVATTRGSVR